MIEEFKKVNEKYKTYDSNTKDSYEKTISFLKSEGFDFDVEYDPIGDNAACIVSFKGEYLDKIELEPPFYEKKDRILKTCFEHLDVLL